MVAGWQQSAVEPGGCVPQPASAMSEQRLQTGEEILATRACFVDSQSRAEGLPRGSSPPCPGTGIFLIKKGALLCPVAVGYTAVETSCAL